VNGQWFLPIEGTFDDASYNAIVGSAASAAGTSAAAEAKLYAELDTSLSVVRGTMAVLIPRIRARAAIR